MSNLFKDINFLKHFSSRILVLDICFVYAFDSHMFSGKFVDSESDFTKGTLAQEFDKLVEV
jgi:hypothetical protein